MLVCIFFFWSKWLRFPQVNEHGLLICASLLEPLILFLAVYVMFALMGFIFQLLFLVFVYPIPTVSLSVC